MTSMPPRDSKLVEWAKSGVFDVERAERLAAAYKAPWQINAPGTPVVGTPANAALPSPRELIGSADTLVANDNAAAPGVRSLAEAPPYRMRTASEPPEIPVAKSQRLALMMAAAGGLALLLALTVWALQSDDSGETTEKAPAAAGTSNAAKQGATKPATAAAAPAQAELAAPPLVGVTITVQPAEASLLLNGEEVSNPYQGQFEQGSSHALLAKADGYVDRELKLRFDKPRDVNVKLKAKALAQTKPRAAKRPARAVRPARAETRRPAKKATAEKGAGFITDNPY